MATRKTKNLVQRYKHLYKELQKKELLHINSASQALAMPQLQEYEEEIPLRTWQEIPFLKSYCRTETSLALMRKKNFNLSRMHLFWKDAIKEFGPIVKLSFPGQPSAVAVAHPDDIKTLHHEASGSTIRSPLQGFFKSPAGDADVQESLWKSRKGLRSLMLNSENIERFLTKTDSVVMDFMERIDGLQKSHGEMPENFHHELYKLAIEALATVCFGRGLGCFDPNLSLDSDIVELIKHLESTVRILPNNNNIVHIWKLIPNESAENVKKIKEILHRIIKPNVGREQAIMQGTQKGNIDDAQPSLVRALLSLPGLTQDDVCSMLLDMFMAGIDSISNSLGFMLYLLARHPQAQRSLRQEVNEIINEEYCIGEGHISQMPYLRACVKEGFRVFPPTFGSLRVLESDVILRNYHVPKGKQVLSLNMIACWDESVFPRASEYIPERWLKYEPLGPIHPFASLPFSYGSKMCMGKRIAEREIHTFLARVIQNYEVDYIYEDMDLLTNPISTPSMPLRFCFTKI